VADTRVEDEVAAAALTGAEIMYCVQGGGPRRLTVDNIAAYAANPPTSDGRALGTAGLQWSDAFFASGAVLNFGGGNYTVNHSPGLLLFNGAILCGPLTINGTVGNYTPIALGTSSVTNHTFNYPASGGAFSPLSAAGDLVIRTENTTKQIIFDTSNGALSLLQLKANGAGVAIGATTASSNTTTGALVIAGGLGVAGDMNWAGTGYTNYTPTIVSITGTITTVTLTAARFKTFGKLTSFYIDFTVTTNGTGATAITATLPNTASNAMAISAINVVTRAALSCCVRLDSATTVSVATVAGAYPAVDGTRIVISGTYENT
jgi:hypothetical protein